MADQGSRAFSRRVFLRRAGFLGTAVAASACGGELPFVAESRPLSESLPENLPQGSAFEDLSTAPPEVQLDRNEAFAEAAERYEFLAARANSSSFLQAWQDGRERGDAWGVSNGVFGIFEQLFLVIDLPAVVNCNAAPGIENSIYIGFDNYVETLETLQLRQPTSNLPRLVQVEIGSGLSTWLADGSTGRPLAAIVEEVIAAQTVDVSPGIGTPRLCQSSQRLTR